MDADPLRGKLLVATPLLGDPNFERTVVLLLDHSDDGALGLVLNRPGDVDVEDPLPEWQHFAGEPEVVFVGGPVARNAVIALAAPSGAPPQLAFQEVVPGVGVLDLSAEPELFDASLSVVRFFAGYAGWGPGQLEAEIGEGAWFVVDARADDAFSDDPEGLWRAVLGRQGGTLAKVARLPDDLRMN